MDHQSSRTARERILELADDPVYRPFIMGYLVQALDERFWPLLVEVALSHVEDTERRSVEHMTRLNDLLEERYR